MSEFFSILTNVGRTQIANAQLTNEAVLITHIAVGDGVGLPNEDMTGLRNETWRGTVARRALSPSDNRVLEIDGHIPSDVGGFYIREAGLFNADGDLVVVANLPESYKPILAEGSGVDTLVRLITTVENADHITLKLDPAIIMASRDWVYDVLMERDVGAATAQMMAANALIQTDLAVTRSRLQDTDIASINARLRTLSLHQSIIADRASRAVLTQEA